VNRQFRVFHLLRSQIHRWVTLLVLVLLFFCTAIGSVIAHPNRSAPVWIAQAQPNPDALTQQATQLYQADRFSEAAAVWQQAVSAFEAAGDRPGQAMALSNLALTQQQLGQWQPAEATLQAALDLLHADPSPERSPLLAQALDVQGRLQLARGQADTALTTWRQAAALYTQLNDSARLTRNHINQAQALQALGLYRRAQTLLTEAVQSLQSQPDSLLKAIGLRSLGNVLRVIGDLDSSRQTLAQSLAVARSQSDPAATSEALLSLGNTARAQQDIPAAQQFYQQAAAVAPAASTQIAAQLYQLNLAIETQQWQVAQALVPLIQPQLQAAPLSRSTLYAQIQFAKSLMQWGESSPTPPIAIAQLLATAAQQAKTLSDAKAESTALGALGELYERSQQWTEARSVTQQALWLAQTIEASELAYQWQWQLGRVLTVQDDRTSAIAAYDGAVKTLQALRYDLVAVNPDVQFSFRDQVEPVYRGLVDLLLGETEPSQTNLQKARTTIEALQLAELNNFFRQACLDTQQTLDAVVDQADQTAAVLYSIILPDRVEVILKQPQQRSLQHYATAIPQAQAEHILIKLRRDLTEPDRVNPAKQEMKQVYDWLIAPIENELAQSQVKTLVFVLDGLLRNIPMSALYNGQHYLIEQYSVALSPGLQLAKPRSLQPQQLQALVAGLSKSRFGSAPLDFVEQEVAQVQSEVSSQVLFNQQFTAQAFESEVNSRPFSVVHLATHGQFSSNADETFVLAWDKPIRVNDLDTVLRRRDERQPDAIDLLVLSACETAEGDDRATLGLAGIAIRAGARSTLASLWTVGDKSTARLMRQFYQALINDQQPRAEALRQAQISLLKTPEYQRPLFWAPYVLVGSWL
jgi:CHAT domain-containing protein/tetratricopeptide (TPR) repeat protein